MESNGASVELSKSVAETGAQANTRGRIIIPHPLLPLDRPASISEGLAAPGLLTFMEVHSGLSARIADEAGFDALWASGLAISSLMGLRDSNEASWSQVLSVVEWIIEASDRPLLVDGDSGHGNFNNARRFAKALSGRGAGGVCFEDKLFPKTNSFVGEGQALADIREFSGRISAARDAVGDGLFSIVARTEALVSGRSMSEAQDRAHAYMMAGADAILIHSKHQSADEVIEFALQWDRAGPLIVVPTTYPSADQAVLTLSGISGLIWANHNIRASMQAMQRLCSEAISGRSMVAVDKELPEVKELFTLLNYDELASSELRYLERVR